MSNGPIYTLGEKIKSSEGIVTYRGFVTSTNEAVYVHALPLESVDLYDQALKLFRSFSIERPILHLFAYEGQPYVITRPGPEQMNFRSWLSAQTAAREKEASPPISFQAGKQYSTAPPSDSSENETITADPSPALARENRNLSTTSIPRETPPGEFTRMFGPLEGSKDKGRKAAPGSSNNVSAPVSMSDPGTAKPVRDGEDPLLKTIRSESKERPDQGGSSPSGVMRPHDRKGSWPRSDFGVGAPERDLPGASQLRAPSPGTLQPEPPKSDLGDFTRVFGNQKFDEPTLTPPERPGNTAGPPGDFTRFFSDDNSGERKISSEPQAPKPDINPKRDIRREDLNAKGPGYGPATQVFKSSRKDVGPASLSSAAGEFTRVYGANGNSDRPLYSTEIPPDSKSDGGGEATQAEQPKVQEAPKNNLSQNQNKRRESNVPLTLAVAILTLLIIGAVITYLALRG